MNGTQSYVGTVLGRYRALFFVLYEDYIEVQRDFVRELGVGGGIE